MFGDLWVASLLNEVNFNKSRNLHKIFTGKSLYKFSYIGIFFGALKKYLTLLFLKFRFCKRKSIGNKHTVFTYGEQHLSFFTDDIDCNEVVFPQGSNYKKIKTNVVYSFLSLYDFVLVAVQYLWAVIKLYLGVYSTVYSFKEIREDLLRSFSGDVCIENLFYIRIFKRLNKLLNYNFTVYYIHEGQGWEKLLNKYLCNKKTVGIVCSVVSQNLFNFFRFQNDYTPNCIAVLGGIQKNQFELVHNNVFIYGSGRYRQLKNIQPVSSRKNKLVVLPYNKQQSDSLLKFVNRSLLDRKDAYVRVNPFDNKTDYSVFGFKFDKLPLEESLSKASIVITTGDTSVVFNAIASGCCVVIVDLSSCGFFQLSCLAESDLVLTVNSSRELCSFIMSFVKHSKLRLINAVPGKRQKMLETYFDFEPNEKQMVQRLLDV
jgi:hypothetical protein